MQHSIADVPVPVFLKKISAEHLSGILIIKGDTFEKSLEFKKGVLVSARSSKLDEKIGVILHLTGKISEAQYDNISGLVQVHGSDQEVGEILVQTNFITPADLSDALLYLTRRIALSTFLLEKGNWEFKKNESSIPLMEDKPGIELHLPEIIVEGSRKIRNIAYFKEKIYFHSPKTTGIPEPLSPLLTAEEVELYEKLVSCQGLSNGEIISKLNILPGFYWEKIVLFIMLDVLEFVEHKMDFNRAEAIKSLLELNEKLRSGSIDEYGILGVNKDASLEELETAYQRVAYLHHPDRFGSASASEIKKISRFVLNRIKFAYQTLEELKKKSMKPTHQQGQEEPGAASPGVKGKKAPGGEAVSPGAQEKDPRFEAANLFEKAEELVNQKNYHEAAQILKNVVKLDPSRGKYFHLLGICQSELFYYEGEAENSLRKAIELDPWNADPVYTLGLLYRKQKKFKLSERCFQRALNINRNHTAAGRAFAELHQQKDGKKKGGFFSLFK